MKPIFALLIFSFSLQTLAQNPERSSSKNEIGLNILPVLFLLNARDDAPDFSYGLRYKRTIKPKLFFRLGINYVKLQPVAELATAVIPQDSGITQFYYHRYKPGYSASAYSGLEYRWGKKRLRYFTGADLGFSYSLVKQQTFLAERTNMLPFIYDGHTPLSATRINFLADDKKVGAKDYTSSYLAFNPFFGCQFFFSEAFFFSAQLGLRYMYPVKKAGINYREAEVYSGLKLSKALLNDFSLCYRF